MLAFLVLRGVPAVVVAAAAATSIPASALGSSAAVWLARRSGAHQCSESMHLNQGARCTTLCSRRLVE